MPADRFFGAAPDVLRTLKARVAANGLELARHGVPKSPFYLTGQVGGQPFSVHAEGERVILTRPQGERQEIDLVPPAPGLSAGLPATSSAPEHMPGADTADLPEPVCPVGVVTSLSEGGSEEPLPAGASPLDAGLDRLAEALAPPLDTSNLGGATHPADTTNPADREGGRP